MKRMIKCAIIFFFIVLFLFMPVNIYANVYTRSSGTVTITADKAKEYQWYVKKDKRWERVKGENRRSFTLLCNKGMNGYRYRCRLNKKKWSKTERIIVTDIGRRYHRKIKPEEVQGMFMPKCADGYCYVHCTNKTLAKHVRKAIDEITKKVGRLFIYTDSPHIADIIVQKWSGNILNESLWSKIDEPEVIARYGHGWAGVTFSDKGLHHLVCVHTDYAYINDEYCRAIIMHELGHCIGITHNEEPGSIMHSQTNVWHLSTKDIERFRTQMNKLRSLM